MLKQGVAGKKVPAIRKVEVARRMAAAIRVEVVPVAARILDEAILALVDMFHRLAEMRAVDSVVAVRFTHRQ